MHYADCGIYDTGYDPYSGDTAFFGKLVKKVARAVSRPVASVTRGIGKAGYGIGKGFVAAAKTAAPIAMQALPYVQQAMKAAGPMGWVASGAAGALAGVVQGKSLENIAWAAAEGASPPGIDRAVMAAKALRKGEPVFNVAINAARQSFVPGSVGQRAFDLGVATVKGGSKGMLANARNQLTTAAQKAAFDSAVGAVSKAAGNLPSAGMGPRLSVPRFRPRVPLSLHRPATAHAFSIMQRNPQFRRLSPGAFANRFGLPLRRVIEARGLIEASGIVDVGLVTDKLWVYTLKSGDTGYLLAQRFTGDGSRWKELPLVNKRGMGGYTGSKDMVVKNTTTTIGGKKVPVTLLDPFFSGLKINLPGDWNGASAGLPEIVASAPPPSGPVTTLPEVIITPGPDFPAPPTAPPPVPPSVPVATPPITIPPVTTPPVPLPPPLPPIPPVTTPPIEIPPATVPVGTTPPPVTTPPITVPPVTPTVPATPATPAEQKKKDATAIAVGAAALAAFLL